MQLKIHVRVCKSVLQLRNLSDVAALLGRSHLAVRCGHPPGCGAREALSHAPGAGWPFRRGYALFYQLQPESGEMPNQETGKARCLDWFPRWSNLVHIDSLGEGQFSSYGRLPCPRAPRSAIPESGSGQRVSVERRQGSG